MSAYEILCNLLEVELEIDCKEGMSDTCGLSNDCSKCKDAIKIYPEYTGKKQIELKKLLLKSPIVDEITEYFSETRQLYVMEVYLISEFASKNRQKLEVFNKEYKQLIPSVLAALVTRHFVSSEDIKEVIENEHYAKEI